MKTIKTFSLLMLISLLSHSCNEVTYPIKIGNDYFIDCDNQGHSVILDSRNMVIIKPQIIAWDYDSIFIIIKQKPKDSIDQIIDEKHPNISFDKYKRFYNESNIYTYWIIDKRKELDSYYDGKVRRYIGAVAGPFTYEEYWEKRRELNVPDSLKLLEAEKVSFPGPVHYLFYKWFYSPPARERVVE